MDKNENEMEILSVEPQNQYINRLTISKVANLGNYENRKIEISVNFSKPENVGTVLTEIEQIIDDINCTKKVDQYELNRARNYLAKPEEELDEWDKKNLATYQKRVDDYEALIAKRKAAIEKLNQFGGTSEFNDAKDSWEED